MPLGFQPPPPPCGGVGHPTPVQQTQESVPPAGVRDPILCTPGIPATQEPEEEIRVYQASMPPVPADEAVFGSSPKAPHPAPNGGQRGKKEKRRNEKHSLNPGVCEAGL